MNFRLSKNHIIIIIKLREHHKEYNSFGVGACYLRLLKEENEFLIIILKIGQIWVLAIFKLMFQKFSHSFTNLRN